MDIDTYRDLRRAGLIDDDVDLEGFDEPPAWIEGFDGYPELLNDMKEETWQLSNKRS